MLKYLLCMLAVPLFLFVSALPASADVWLLVFARDRIARDRDVNLCAEKVDGEFTADKSLTNRQDCQAVGKSWPEEAKAGRMDSGDIHSVFDGAIDLSRGWNKMCANYPPIDGGAYACVKITDKDKAHAKNYVKSKLDSNLMEVEEARFYVNVEALPATAKDNLWYDGEFSGTWAQVKPYIYDKVTGEAIP